MNEILSTEKKRRNRVEMSGFQSRNVGTKRKQVSVAKAQR